MRRARTGAKRAAAETAGTASPGTFSFGTKAETLARLRPLLTRATVLELMHFTVAEWRTGRPAVLERVRGAFGGRPLAVRSSARGEDGAASSHAGVYRSRLGVNGADADELAQAVDDVIASYAGDPGDQVLVQPMLEEVAVSGVIMTHDVSCGAPYYVVNFDDATGSSSSITSGRGVHKVVLVYRQAPRELLRSERVARFISLARELESVCGDAPLDIEFALSGSGELFLLQVRPISLRSRWHPSTDRRAARQLRAIEEYLHQVFAPRPELAGSRTLLGVMPDWNPAEIIGIEPRPLAVTLYQELVTRQTWRQARASMGYAQLSTQELMLVIAGRPFVDVRASFNSFLPPGLPSRIAGPLVDAWLERLETHPEFHDRVEFEIVPTCLDFDFDEQFRQRYGTLLGAGDAAAFRDALTSLTRGCLLPGPVGSLARARGTIAALEARQHARADTAVPDAFGWLLRACSLIEECRLLGTLPFAVLARHAFIAESMLRSAERLGAVAPERIVHFKRSLETVTGRFAHDYARACEGTLDRREFLREYGHLRPGTYDITSLRYDERGTSLFESSFAPRRQEPEPFELSATERTALESLLLGSRLDVLDSAALLDYARAAICGREHAKLVFTRNLSDALLALGEWGRRVGLDRDDLSHLEWPQIARAASHAGSDAPDREFLDLADARRRLASDFASLKLGYMLRRPEDIYVATLHRSTPTFIGSGRVEGAVVHLEANSPVSAAVYGKIVCIENADPGFDWIFARDIRALVTMFGGANSHMAVRCAEFGLPAAIGCGEQAFKRVLQAGQIELNCAHKVISPLHGQ